MSGFDLAIKVKVCVLGETVGKSSAINRFVNKTFSGQHIQHENMEQIHRKQLKLFNKTFDLFILKGLNINIHISQQQYKLFYLMSQWIIFQYEPWEISIII